MLNHLLRGITYQRNKYGFSLPPIIRSGRRRLIMPSMRVRMKSVSIAYPVKDEIEPGQERIKKHPPERMRHIPRKNCSQHAAKIIDIDHAASFLAHGFTPRAAVSITWA